MAGLVTARGKTCQTCAGRRKPRVADLFWGWCVPSVHGNVLGGCPPTVWAFLGEHGCVWDTLLSYLWLSYPAQGSGAGLPVHQSHEGVCTCSFWCRGPAVGAQPPPPGAGTATRAVLPRGCQLGGCQNSASGCNKGGELSLVGIFPCRAVNSVTGSEVSLPPCPGECPRRPQLNLGGSRPMAHPWLPRAAPTLCLARRPGGLPCLLAGLSRSSVTQSAAFPPCCLNIARRDVRAGNVPLRDGGRSAGLAGQLPPLSPRCPRAE